MAQIASRAPMRACGRSRWFVALLVLSGCDSAGKMPAGSTTNPQSDEAPSPKLVVAANDALTRAPLDATPSPDGKQVYYTALGTMDGESVPGVFGVSGDGGGQIQMLSIGGAITAPVGISVSSDGQQLFLADAATELDTGSGAVLTLASGGGDATPLSGTEGYKPRGVAIASEQGKDWVYFSGRSGDDTQTGVFRVPSDGGQPEAVAASDMFQDPAGIAVADNGDVYAVDGSGSAGLARLLRVHKGAVNVVLDNIGVGFPAGVTLTRDGKTALVSGLDPTTKHDVVYYVELASGTVSYLRKPIAGFAEPAGLHRAHNADVFAWADSEANDTGTVYLLKPQS